MRRIKYGLAVFAAIAVSIGLKFYFFSPPVAAKAEVAGMDIAAMHAAASHTMPRHELNDMAFGFSQ